MDFHLEQITRELKRRESKNSRYSLRAFAAFLNLDPSALSRILSGKQELSIKAGMVAVKKLQLSKNDGRRFMQSLIERRRRKEAAHIGKQVAAPDLRPTPFELTPQLYAKVAKLPYLGFLELTFTENFKSDPHWIANRLGMNLDEVNEMIEILLKAGLLRREGAKLVNSNIHITAIQAKETNSIRQGLQEEILNEAIRSLRHDSFERRAHYGMTMAVDASKIQYAQKRIREFIEVLNDELAGDSLSEVYQLGIQFFPLSGPVSGEGSSS